MFGKHRDMQYLVWNGNVITRYKGQPVTLTVSMKPYLDERYDPEKRNQIIEMFDACAFKFNTLITLSYFQGDLSKIRK